MPHLVFPLQVSATSATVWVGAINENFDPAQIALTINQAPVPLSASWEQWRSQDDERRIDFQRVTIAGRQPGTAYDLECLVNGAVKSTARLTTLPAQLPSPADSGPFIVLLGSCFYEPKDDGRAGKLFRRMPAGAKPHVKLLCGDQVYLDNPAFQFILPRSRSGLEKNFLKKYLKNWTQQSDGEGYREVLKAGANFFCADDHEYWNNFPFGASYLPQTWVGSGRERWHAATEPLYRIFQTTAPAQTFEVGNLSFFIADTRSTRDEDRRNFLAPAAFEQLRQWVNNLTGPGALALGQAIFAGKSSELGGRFGDFGLPDFKQYEELVKVLSGATHSLLLLTGDVHFGRVASCTLPSGARLIEVISSPMSLVSSTFGGNWAAPPERFPAFPIPDVVQRPIETAELRPGEVFKLEGNHFATLEFTQLGAKVKMTAKYWPVGDDDEPLAPVGLPEVLLQ
jgi:hypothetical protein